MRNGLIIAGVVVLLVLGAVAFLWYGSGGGGSDATVDTPTEADYEQYLETLTPEQRQAAEALRQMAVQQMRGKEDLQE